MYTRFEIEDKKTNENAVSFAFDGRKVTIGSAFKWTEISREELDALIAWLRCNLEKIDRDAWDAEHKKNCSCHGVNVANE